MQRVWHQPMNVRRLPLAALLSAVVAIAADIGIRAAGEHWLDVPPDQSYLSTTVIVVTVVAATLLATIVLALLGQTQARPFSVFRLLALVVFLLACVGPLLARLGWLPGTQINGDTFLVLMLMNAATAIVIVAFLTTLPREHVRQIGF